ncbi:hypothetical protein EUX98_g8294 [Antrodiella citrinella]|uniref:Cytochrome P450 n=1 Tax=Antrodiella citrinella TaxID=2447956 RepID=A0A4V3XGK2_9APHY|nr:hypothetical protein EUX98_g8294 [Antrodiella citrinella]
MPAHFSRFIATLILDIAYGYQVNTDDDALVDLGEATTHNIALAGSAGSITGDINSCKQRLYCMLVDFLPFLKHYPTWLPGSAWKKHIEYTAVMVEKMQTVPYNTVKSSLVCLHLALCLRALIERCLTGNEMTDRYAENEKDIRGVATSLYAAGTETVATTMQVFILAMLIYPDVLVKAQEEMDHVIGSGRLPELYDRENLPYLNAIIKETYSCEGGTLLFLLKCSIVILSSGLIFASRGMSRDEGIYSDSEAFLPERFMNKEEALDPKSFVFGFGRRLCPGREFADTCIFMVLSNIVATMDILRAKDERGNEITPQAIFTDGLASRPARLDCVLKPRTQQARDLILLQDTNDTTFSAQ